MPEAGEGASAWAVPAPADASARTPTATSARNRFIRQLPACGRVLRRSRAAAGLILGAVRYPAGASAPHMADSGRWLLGHVPR
ncbi:hypothetical protein Slala02_56340 [Streptomyces lavendulae subsp. lavendulae]|nr:hypothetical protein Slala01_57500 [Streptomyces lavendulae subsp. lavendulae]GLX29814.1 hypothetical protein Slala02_56340 [Streptomyces lavendulae subsp. lavendulae]